MPVKSSRSNTGPSPLDSHLGFWMRLVSNQVSAAFAKRLETKSITLPEWVALRTLYDEVELISHANMIAVLGMTKSAASKVLTRLEEKGLIERGYKDESAKTQVITLTKKGQQLVPQLASIADQNDDFYFGHMSVADKEKLFSLLRELVNHHQFTNIPID
jgi:DNA-binding MarR family transcriptional regulator